MLEQSSFVLFFEWLFFESTARVIAVWLFFLKFGLRFFSVSLLMRTFFSPWHRYGYGYPKSFNPSEWFWAFFGNGMSRVIGMILRVFFIAFGLVFSACIFAIGLAAAAFWIALPFASVYLFYAGLQLVLR